jgi:hypothetical protein
MAKKVPYQETLKQEMQEIIDQLDLPEIKKKAIAKRWLDQVLWFENKSGQCRKSYNRLRLFIIIGGIVLPALMTMSGNINEQQLSSDQQIDRALKRGLATAPFVLSISIAIAAAVEEFCRFGDRFRQYRQSAEALKSEGWQYLQGSGAYADSKSQTEAYPLFAARVESIIQKDVEIYITEISKEKPKDTGSPAVLPEGYSPQALAGTMMATWTTPPQMQPAQTVVSVETSVQMDTPTEADPFVTSTEAVVSPTDPVDSLMPSLDYLPVGDPDDPKPVDAGTNGLLTPQSLLSTTPPPVPPPTAATNGAIPVAPAAAEPSNIAAIPVIAKPAPPPVPQANILVKVEVDTIFKLAPRPSDQLKDQEKVLVKSGSIYGVQSFAPAESNHVRVALTGAFLGSQNRNTWFVYAPHVELDGTDPDNRPDDKDDPPPQPKGKAIELPGISTAVHLSDSIIPDGSFTWAEATKNGTRIPADKNVVDGIIRVAKAMQEVRSYLGDRPIRVNSWYRDPSTNRRVGGARDSRHMRGDAVDFVVEGMRPSEVHARLDPWWGSRGGLASSSSFTHIDTRGVKARWRYSS